MRNILILIILVSGLIFTSVIKNKTRLLEKKLVYLNNEIIILNSNFSEASLDYEYLTAPKNISVLAKNFLDEDFSYYTATQINGLDEKVTESYTKLNKFEEKKNMKNLEKLISNNSFNSLIAGKLITKDSLISKKNDSKKIYKSKKNVLDSKKVQRWAGLQIVKALLGIPIVPAR